MNSHVILVLLVLLPILTLAGYLLISNSQFTVRKPKSKVSLVQRFQTMSAIPIFFAVISALFSHSLLLVALFSVTSVFVYKYEREGESRSKKRAQSAITQELPAIVEVFSILVSGGESLPVALNRISQRTRGAFADSLRRAVEKLRHGMGLTAVLDFVAVDCDVPEVRRFCDSLIVALERGTSLADVLARQIQEIRSQQHSKMLAAAGKAEVALLIPVVFLILPISVVFALWPSYLSLNVNIGG